MASCSVSQKVDAELGQAPTFQAGPRDTDYPRPSNLVTRTLRPAEHTPSKCGHDPCPVRRGLAAAAKCCVRKARFFLCRQVNRNDPSLPMALLADFSTMKGKPVLFSVFGHDNCCLYDPSLQTALLAGFSAMKGKPVLFSVFGYDNCWPFRKANNYRTRKM